MGALPEFRERYGESVERMFAAVSELYAQYWHDYFHFALFERGDESWDEAFAATHRRYLAALRADRAENAIDLACGRGGFAALLARHTAGQVLGIDLSRAQLAHCARFERPNLRFRHHDVMHVDALGETFDAVSFLDAECYLPDKRQAVERITAVMRPGARFLLLAWCKADGVTALQERVVIEPFMRYWAVPGLETPKGYERHFRRAGLTIVEARDLNEAARRNWEFGYEQALKAVGELSLERAAKLVWKGLRLGPDGLRLLQEQFPAALYIKAAFDAGLLRYRYFVLQKDA